MQLIDAKVDALQNLEQVYVLHVNERYKNLFLSQLRTVIIRGVLAAVALAVVTVIVAGIWTLAHQSGSSQQPKSSPRPTHSAGLFSEEQPPSALTVD
jgi:hypothetical protein